MITRRVTVFIVIIIVALSSAILVAYDVSYPSYVTSTFNSTMNIGSDIKGQNITTIGRWKYSIFCCLAFSVSKDNSSIGFSYVDLNWGTKENLHYNFDLQERNSDSQQERPCTIQSLD